MRRARRLLKATQEKFSMRIRTLLLAILVLAVVLFAALNWVTFTTPTALSLGVATVQAPLGLIMLCLLVAATALFLAWVIYLQGSVLLETRRQAKELQAQRDLADKAEASRFTELRQFMSAELTRVTQSSSETRSNLLSRLDALEQRQRAALEQTGNSLAAAIGELEDRLERRHVPPDVPRSGAAL
jgi:uncharacterized integral membrane protein